MPFHPETEDRIFLLNKVLPAPAQWQALAPFAEVDAALATQVLEEAGTFAAEVLARASKPLLRARPMPSAGLCRCARSGVGCCRSSRSAVRSSAIVYP